MVCVRGPAGWTSAQNLDRHWSLIFLRWHLARAHTHIYVNLKLQEDWNVVVLSQVFFCQVEIFKNLLLTLFWINSFQWSGFVAGCQVTAVSLLYLSLWNKSCELLSLNDFTVWEQKVFACWKFSMVPAHPHTGEWLIYLHLFWINQFGFFALSITNVICCYYMTLFCCLFWGTR